MSARDVPARLLDLPRFLPRHPEYAEALADSCGDVAGVYVILSWSDVSSAGDGIGSMLAGILRRRGAVVVHLGQPRPEWLGDRPHGAPAAAPTPAAFDDHLATTYPCRLPPRGWSCSRPAGHDGSCPARARWWLKPWRLLLGRPV